MLIHTTLIYAGLLGLLLVILSFNVMQNWVRVTGEGHQTDRAMRRAERLLSSFVEYVPLGLILLTLIELKGAPALDHPYPRHHAGDGARAARLWQQRYAGRRAFAFSGIAADFSDAGHRQHRLRLLFRAWAGFDLKYDPAQNSSAARPP